MPLCPFLNQECVRYKCQLWDNRRDGCSFYTLVEIFDEINDKIATAINKLVLKAH